MQGFRRRTRLIGLVSALAIALSTGVMAATAAPARADPPICYDYTNAQPTPVHSTPADETTNTFLEIGTLVSGPCIYYENIIQGYTLYMKVSSPDPGYIWVQRLDSGQSHDCYYNNMVVPIGSGSCIVLQYV